MGYKIIYRRQAVAYLKRLSAERREHILKSIERLVDDPRGPGLDLKALARRPAFRLRVGHFRVIFERHRDILLIIVVLIRTRGDVYKR